MRRPLLCLLALFRNKPKPEKWKRSSVGVKRLAMHLDAATWKGGKWGLK